MGRCLKSIVRRIAERMSIVNCQVLAKKGIVYCQVLAKKSDLFGLDDSSIYLKGAGAKRAKVRESVRLYRLKK